MSIADWLYNYFIIVIDRSSNDPNLDAKTGYPALYKATSALTNWLVTGNLRGVQYFRNCFFNNLREISLSVVFSIT